MDSKPLFIEIVRATKDLPRDLREHAGDVTALEEHRFDRSYIAFLEEQIRLSPRGPEWTEILKHRCVALQPFCDVRLLRGTVRAGDICFSIEIDPQAKTVIHWEPYEYDHAA